MALERGERVLATARTAATSGPGVDPPGADASSEDAPGYAVATDRALHVWAGSGARRLPYESITKAVWDADASTLGIMVAGSSGSDPMPARVDLPLASPGFLPETVRERVQATIIYSRHVLLDGTKGVLMSARRAPGAAEARWTLAFDSGVDARNPELRERVARLLAQVRNQTGI